MARKFLYIVAALIVVVLVVLVGLRLFSDDLLRMAFEPEAKFKALPPPGANAYRAMDMWIARPGLGANDPSRCHRRGCGSQPDALHEDGLRSRRLHDRQRADRSGR